MTCPDDIKTVQSSTMWPFENWSRTRSHTVPIRFEPTDDKQLVAAVQAAEMVSGVARAVGSGWSYPDVAIAPEVMFAITTDSLVGILNGTSLTQPDEVIPFALNDTARADARHYIHVRAGIKIHDLNCALDDMGLAMITLGGSNGQSLAGAISTGTHGSQIDMPPIADVVRAIHLVGPGGQEWWIERSGARAITDPTRMAQAVFAQKLCSDIRIEYEDLLFNAVLVSAGRMGIIHSYVVKVTDAFLLKQTRDPIKPWTDVSNNIRTKIRDSLNETEFVEIVVNPYMNASGDHDCVITRKKTVNKPITPPSDSSAQSFAIFCNITALNAVLDAVAPLLGPLITAATATAVASISWMMLIPFVGPELFATAATAAVTAVTTGLVALNAAVIAARAAPGDDLAQKLTSILNTMTDLGHKELVPLLTEQLLLTERNPMDPDVVQKSFQVLTGQDPCSMPWAGIPKCMRQVDGLEYALDLSPGSEKLFGFIDGVIALTDEFLTNNMPPAFGMSLRFTKGTEALIGMQQFSRTCSVEFIMLRGMKGESDFLKRLYGIAMQHDAIPHWGLMHEIDAVEVSRLYGDRLRFWRLILGRLIEQGGGKIGTFRTSYSVTHGLEPLFGGLVISNNRQAPIQLWDPTPQVEGSTTSTGIYLWNRSNYSTVVNNIRITTPDDLPGAPLFHSLTTLPLTIGAGQMVLINVSFSPIHAGPIKGMVQVDCDDPVTPRLRVPLATSATNLGRHADLQLAPTSIDFGTIRVGTTVGQNLTLTNTGFYTAYFDNIAVTLDHPVMGQFAVPVVHPGSLIAGQSDTIYVSYNPTTRGSASAMLAIDLRSRSDNGVVEYRNRYQVPLNGVALMPTIFLASGPLPTRPRGSSLPGPFGPRPGHLPLTGQFHPLELELRVLDFGKAAPNTGGYNSFWIRNVGDAPLTVQGVTVVNQGYFGITDVTIFPATVAPGGEMEVSCNFLAPPVPGMPIAGEFQVVSDDPLRPSAILIVEGKATGAHLNQPIEVLDLGVVPPASASATINFKSDGTDPVTIKKITLATGTDFSLSGVPQMPAQLPPGTQLTLTVTLTPTQSGYLQDQLLLAHDGNPSGKSKVLLRARVP